MAQLSVGIVGLPNVGKSTLFEALTAVSVPAENYPFCTIDPNVGVVEVPDPRLEHLGELCAPRRPVPAVVEFLDIAGLVEGASRGEGLGNRFLHHIGEVDAIAHVIRCFDDPAVARVGTDPEHDVGVIETELSLADLGTVERRLESAERKARSGDREAMESLPFLRELRDRLNEGRPARHVRVPPGQRALLHSLHLLTAKPVMYVANVSEEELTDPTPELVRLREVVSESDPAAPVVVICGRLEAEISRLDSAEREEFLSALGLSGRGLDRLIGAGYRLLGLQTFFTIGEEEVRAWTVPIGSSAPDAAGRVHTDFQRSFIRAETVHYEEFVKHGSMRAAREQGAVRSEGKDYAVRDGDILFFRTGA